MNCGVAWRVVWCDCQGVLGHLTRRPSVFCTTCSVIVSNRLRSSRHIFCTADVHDETGHDAWRTHMLASGSEWKDEPIPCTQNHKHFQRHCTAGIAELRSVCVCVRERKILCRGSTAGSGMCVRSCVRARMLGWRLTHRCINVGTTFIVWFCGLNANPNTWPKNPSHAAVKEMKREREREPKRERKK